MSYFSVLCLSVLCFYRTTRKYRLKSKKYCSKRPQSQIFQHKDDTRKSWCSFCFVDREHSGLHLRRILKNALGLQTKDGGDFKIKHAQKPLFQEWKPYIRSSINLCSLNKMEDYLCIKIPYSPLPHRYVRAPEWYKPLLQEQCISEPPRLLRTIKTRYLNSTRTH